MPITAPGGVTIDLPGNPFTQDLIFTATFQAKDSVGLTSQINAAKTFKVVKSQ
jgi:hypothetical protein